MPPLNDLLKLKMFNPQAFNEKFGGIETVEDGIGSQPAAALGTQWQSNNFDFSGAGDAISAISSKDELNAKFMERNKNISKQIQGASGLSNTAASVASKFGPWGMAAAGALKAGDALMKSATDEFGIVKNTGKAVIGGILNPIAGISALTQQKERKEAKNRFVNTELSSKKAESQVEGNKITNSIPKYSPPSYGRFGGKLTKFTR